MRTRAQFWKIVTLVGLLLSWHWSTGVAVASPANDPGPATRHRVIVLTDIEADPDDTQSMVRLLLYSDEIEIQGLIATTSTHLRTSVHPESIRAVIAAYGKVHRNLTKHDPRYPRSELLETVVKQGRPEYGMGGVGPGKDTEGSDWIIRTLQHSDDRPLWISVWGGANTLAQALHTLRTTRPAAEVERLVAKLRVYTISDQDDAGPWIRREFPALFYIVSPGGNYTAATWTGINTVVAGIDNTTISNRWIAENLQQDHGPLGAMYPDVAWGVEGDTPSWLALIPNGLSVPEHPEWGGWGGRYELYRPDISVTDPRTFIGNVPIEPETRPIWTNAVDEVVPPVRPEFGRATRAGEKTFRDFKATLWRWRDDFQNDFAARMAWTTKPFDACNHPPVPALDHPATLAVKSGQGFGLGAHRTTDPDGDSLSYLWFHYPEAGSYKTPVTISGAENTPGVWITAPIVDQRETLHFILRVTDKGTPALSRYARVIVTVTP
ncbi:DUF1593 domain-containing protein [Opitutus terrae]|uniref:Uncharacterized protein n=1 Tax=Opitutus terrae (strain DSM 11246 / JCM 15787 / PB90-1) TaxID=452637 RepID=B1ZMX7_OPITP|nr:DUF1593 domain-containing protein [Opitutus terrae]ACB75405.1 protein of unknown function DUF1593 [Opitutus terrae PB90-1]